MLDKFKQVNELRKLRAEAMKMKKQLSQDKTVIEEGDFKIVVTGDQEVRSVEIKGEEQKELVGVLNKALKKAQQQAAMKLAQMSGGLGSLMGKL